MRPPPPSLPPRRRWLLVPSFFAAALVLGVVLWPAALGSALVAVLEAEGARAVHLDHIAFNPFTGRARLRGLSMEEPDGTRALVGSAEAVLDLGGLWDRRIRLRTLTVEAAATSVERGPDGAWRVAGIALGAGPDGDDAGPGWALGADSVDIERVALVYRANGTAQSLFIENLRAANLAPWRPLEASAFELAARLDGGRIAAAGSVLPFSENPSVALALELAAIDLSAAERFLPQDAGAQLAGTLDADLDLKVHLSDDGAVTLALPGTVSINGLSATAGDRSFTQARARWTGTADLDLQPPGLAVLLDGTLDLGGTRLDGGARTLGFDALTAARWQLALAARPAAGLTFELDADAALKGLNATLPGGELGQDTLTWKGRAEGSLAPEAGALNLTVAGAVNATALRLAAVGTKRPHTLSIGALAVADGTAAVLLDGAAELSGSGRLSMAGIALQVPDLERLNVDRVVIDAAESSLAVDGRGAIETASRAALSIDGLEAAHAGRVMSQARARWNGTANVDVGTDGLTAALDGQLALGGTRLEDGGGARMVRFDSLKANRARLGLETGSTGGLSFDLDADATLTGFDATLPEGALGQGALSWTGQATGSLAPATGFVSLSVGGAVDGRDLRLEARGTAPPQSLSLDRFTVADGAATARLDDATELAVRGKLTAGGISLRAPEMEDLGAEAVVIDAAESRLRRSADRAVEIAARVAVAIDGLAGRNAESDFRAGRLEWDGSLEARTGDGGAPLAFGSRGEGQSRALSVRLLAPKLVVRQEASTWRGSVSLAPRDGQDAPRLLLEADARSTDLTVDSIDLGWRLLRIGGLDLAGLRLGGNAFARLATLEAQDVQMLVPVAENTVSNGGTALRMDYLQVREIAAPTPFRVVADELVVEGATSTFLRNEAGEVVLVGPVNTLLTGIAALETPAAGPGFSVRIADATVGGGSRLFLEDRSVFPPVLLGAEPFEGRISDLDTADPENDSPVALSANFGRYGQLEVAGTIRPLAPRLTLDLNGELKDFELPVLSPYASKQLGYDLERGRLDIMMDLEIADGQIQANNEVTLEKLKVRESDSEAARPLREELVVPLPTALSLLKDSDGTISLDVPIDGDIASPRFDYSQAINQAIGKAMKTSVIATANFAFPVTGLFSLTKLAGKPRVEFQPVPFRPGEPAMAEGGADYVDDLGDLMQDRPGVELALCGTATREDRAVLEQPARRAFADSLKVGLQGPEPRAAAGGPAASRTGVDLEQAEFRISPADLLELASRRAAAVRTQLTARNGVDVDRLFLCAPRIDLEEGAKPRVEVLL